MTFICCVTRRFFVYGLVDSDKFSFADKFDVTIKAHYSTGG
jgi:hypothetical protein